MIYYLGVEYLGLNSLFVSILLICCIVPNLFFLIIYRNHREFLQSMEIVNRITKGKLKGVRRL